jgi:hypothetical protein
MIGVWLGRMGLALVALALILSFAMFLVSFWSAAWLTADARALMQTLNFLIYGLLIVAMVLNVPLGLALRHAAKVVPSVQSSLPRILTPLWPVGIMILVGLALLFGALYITNSWAMPPLDDTKEALARLTESGATRNLRSSTLSTMGLSLVYGGLVLSWLYRYADVRRAQSSTSWPYHGSRPEQRPDH